MCCIRKKGVIYESDWDVPTALYVYALDTIVTSIHAEWSYSTLAQDVGCGVQSARR